MHFYKLIGFNSDEYGYFLSRDARTNVAVAKSFTYSMLIKFLYQLWLPQTVVMSPELITSILDEYKVANNPKTTTYISYLNHIQSDVLFICQAFSMAETYSNHGNQVFMYQFKYRISSSPYDQVYGVAVHTDDLPHVFGEALSNKVRLFRTDLNNKFPKID